MNTIYIDTHCHLNFNRFSKTRDQVIREAQHQGVGICIVPGTDITSSQKALAIADKYSHIFAAVGIHPHHIYSSQQSTTTSQRSIAHRLRSDMEELEKIIIHPKVVAVGEIGLDRHEYEATKYENYAINEEFMQAQKEYFRSQIRLATKYKKALIIHNRETKKELLTILSEEWAESMRFRTVFHCSEPDEELLTYAQSQNIFIGIDGDVTYGGEKAQFAQKVPLELLVLETDSPFLLPEPLRAQKLYPNTPSNIPLIAQYISNIKGIAGEEVARVTTENAKKLFSL